MRWLLALVGVLLAGYAFGGKGFAYVGVAPIFISEIVLALGVAILIVTIGVTAIPMTVPMILLLLFMAWGVTRTLPYLGVYGLDALRDAVQWGYAGYALFIAAALRRTGLYEVALKKYSAVLPWFLLWAPIGLALSTAFQHRVPTIPGTLTPILYLKGGDVGVMIGAGMAFLLLGLHRFFVPSRPLPEGLSWAFAILGLIAAASINRGGFVAILAAIVIVMIMRPTQRLGRLVLVGSVLLAILVLIDFEADIGQERQISVRQVLVNLGSIFGFSNSEFLEGTIHWRTLWWGTIIEYTVWGDHFWLGKGYGIDLTWDDWGGTPMLVDTRNPHNATITALARTGVPGAAMWLAMNSAFVVSLAAAYRRALQAGHEILARINVWLIAFWAALFTNMSFDVYLEGPQGGIWFWSVIGFGIAFVDHQRRMFESPEFHAAGGVPAHQAATR